MRNGGLTAEQWEDVYKESIVYTGAQWRVDHRRRRCPHCRAIRTACSVLRTQGRIVRRQCNRCNGEF